MVIIRNAMLALLLLLTAVVNGFISIPCADGDWKLRSGNSPENWKDLESLFQEHIRSPGPVSIDTVLNPEKPDFSSENPTLFRERHGWCPYSERVFLFLEHCNIPYETIRIDNTGGPRPSYYGGGTTPQIRWPDGRIQGESMDIVEALDEKYQCNLHSADASRITNQFRSIFPRARPSSRAAYLFQYNGEPLWKSTFEETLQKTDELLGLTSGPFFCGGDLSTADISWAPFLERYRYQLPCLHEGLNPNDSVQYPHLAKWYRAMDKIPAYACRIKGDASSWRKVLTMAGFGNAGLPPTVRANMDARMHEELKEAKEFIDLDTWKKFSVSRTYMAESPHAEASLTVVRNRRALVKDAMKHAPKWPDTIPKSEADVDGLFLDLAINLLDSQSEASPEVVRLATFLDDRMCVPRDMGAMSAACIKLLAYG